MNRLLMPLPGLRLPTRSMKQAKVLLPGFWPGRTYLYNCLHGRGHACKLLHLCPRCCKRVGDLLFRQLQGVLLHDWPVWHVTLVSNQDMPETAGAFRRTTDPGINVIRHLQEEGLIVGAVVVRELGLRHLQDNRLQPHVHAVVLLPKGASLADEEGTIRSRLRHWLPKGWEVQVRELATHADRKQNTRYLVKPVPLGETYEHLAEEKPKKNDTRKRAPVSTYLLNQRTDRLAGVLQRYGRHLQRFTRFGVCHPRSQLGKELRISKQTAKARRRADWEATGWRPPTRDKLLPDKLFRSSSRVYLLSVSTPPVAPAQPAKARFYPRTKPAPELLRDRQWLRSREYYPTGPRVIDVLPSTLGQSGEAPQSPQDGPGPPVRGPDPPGGQ